MLKDRVESYCDRFSLAEPRTLNFLVAGDHGWCVHIDSPALVRTSRFKSISSVSSEEVLVWLILEPHRTEVCS